MPLSSAEERMFSNLSLANQFDEIVRTYKMLTEGSCEKEILQLAQHFESCRKKWKCTELKSMDLQAKLTKCEAEKNALMIKLKHARRQIEVELQYRHQAEQERDELAQQLALVRELLLSDSAPSPSLTEEQQRQLEFLNSSRFKSPSGRARAARRLDPIDETGSLLTDYSDISFDVTEDDLDQAEFRNGKRWKRSRIALKRDADDDETLPKKGKVEIGPNESLHCFVDGPATMYTQKLNTSFSKPNPHQGRRRPSREHLRKSITSESESQSDVDGFWPSAPTPSVRTKFTTCAKHKLQTKPCVITKETCKVCGVRIQFGKKALKCVDCKLVTHPDCEEFAKEFPCELASNTASRNTLKQFLISDEAPQIPPIVYHTVQEIERRGLDEVGLYRVPGMIRVVKELSEKFKGRSVPNLTEVADVHTLCSLVKSFLRETINEPIITFSMRPKFIEAAKFDDENAMCNVLNELCSPNRDTLMFLLLHFQRIVDTPETRMSVEALSKAIGPSIVGYQSAEPSTEELQSAAGDQEAVLTRLLQVPAQFYSSALESCASNVMSTPKGNRPEPGTPDSTKPYSSMLGPIGSPAKKTPSSSSLAEKARKYLGGTPFGKNRQKETSYFNSPTLN